MYYVYILKSTRNNSYYIGSTQDLRARVRRHNSGYVPHTSKNIPYKLVWYCCFSKKQKATRFELYLKHGSGFAFSRKHLV